MDGCLLVGRREQAVRFVVNQTIIVRTLELVRVHRSVRRIVVRVVVEVQWSKRSGICGVVRRSILLDFPDNCKLSIMWRTCPTIAGTNASIKAIVSAGKPEGRAGTKEEGAEVGAATGGCVVVVVEAGWPPLRLLVEGRAVVARLGFETTAASLVSASVNSSESSEAAMRRMQR